MSQLSADQGALSGELQNLGLKNDRMADEVERLVEGNTIEAIETLALHVRDMEMRFEEGLETLQTTLAQELDARFGEGHMSDRSSRQQRGNLGADDGPPEEDWVHQRLQMFGTVLEELEHTVGAQLEAHGDQFETLEHKITEAAARYAEAEVTMERVTAQLQTHSGDVDQLKARSSTTTSELKQLASRVDHVSSQASTDSEALRQHLEEISEQLDAKPMHTSSSGPDVRRQINELYRMLEAQAHHVATVPSPQGSRLHDSTAGDDRIAELEEVVRDLSEAVTRAQVQSEQFASGAGDFNDLLKELQQGLGRKIESIEGQLQQMASSSKGNADAREQLVALAERCASCETTQSSVRSQVDAHERKISTLQGDASKATERGRDLDLRLTQVEGQIKKAQEAVEELVEGSTGAGGDAKPSPEVRELKQQVVSCVSAVDSLTSQVRELSASAQASAGRGGGAQLTKHPGDGTGSSSKPTSNGDSLGTAPALRAGRRLAPLGSPPHALDSALDASGSSFVTSPSQTPAKASAAKADEVEEVDSDISVDSSS